MSADFDLNCFRQALLKMVEVNVSRDTDRELAESAARDVERVLRMIDAMTDDERISPDIIDRDRISRIAASSETDPYEVRDLLRQFRNMRNMMRRFDQLPPPGRSE